MPTAGINFHVFSGLDHLHMNTPAAGISIQAAGKSRKVDTATRCTRFQFAFDILGVDTATACFCFDITIKVIQT